MVHRIEVSSSVQDSRAKSFISRASSFDIKVAASKVIDVYTIVKNLPATELADVAGLLTNPVIEKSLINTASDITGYDWAIEIGYLPGVTDNVATTVREEIEDMLGKSFGKGDAVYSSRLYFVKSGIGKNQAGELALTLYNPLIQRAEIKSAEQYQKTHGMSVAVPKVTLKKGKDVKLVDLDVSDEELTKIGKQGIANDDGSRRGPLALDLESLKTIRDYFHEQNRKPTDIELEAIAQTWSEHCKHTIFAAKFDEIKDGLYKGYIKKATQEIRRAKGKNDICVSVFTDNSGAIIFDEDSLITDKVETHNSPSALDPFGGAVTGIVGVNRDTIGFGMGAKPTINRYGYCFADPRDKRPLYKGANKTQKMLSPRKIMEGVIEGVNIGGNCSGIPAPQGFACFNDNYRGKPLVFVGTIGVIPRKINGVDSTHKQAQNGDLVVVVGGRVGADGVHGATFSSEAMDSGSPATAVQIGDPITQKKLSDAIIKEARDQGLYTSITDNGAGGISCSVAEMAKETNGCVVELDKVPLKYEGLSPWEIWISESQERMTLAIPKANWPKFKTLMDSRGVEAIAIGKFNNSGTCIVRWKNEEVMNVEMEFLHEGLPEKSISSTYTKIKHDEPKTACPNNLTSTLNDMLGRLNITSIEFISKQYDHEVQAGSVIKPLLGKGRVNGSASVTRPKLTSNKGVVLSQALYPSYSDIDTYHMAACAIDEAIRNAIAVGGDLDHLALLDNFCWCSSTEPERLGQLKAAVKACYDYSTLFGTPFISGKDSMFNDFVGYDENENKVKISVPPTLLISSIGVVDDVRKSVDLVPKCANDLVYVVGDTFDELGGSEYFAYLGEKAKNSKFIGNNIPKVDGDKAKQIYQSITKAINSGLIASAVSLTVGGLGAGLAKMAVAGGLGLDIDLSKLESGVGRDDYLMFSESQSRLVVTVDPSNKSKFEKIMKGSPLHLVGKVRSDNKLAIVGLNGQKVVNENTVRLENSYKETLGSY